MKSPKIAEFNGIVGYLTSVARSPLSAPRASSPRRKATAARSSLRSEQEVGAWRMSGGSAPLVILSCIQAFPF
ncbi:hypothetical protein D3C86_1863230 [compost metagenome]